MPKRPSNVRDLNAVQRPVVMRALDALVPYARNARTHSEAQVAQIAASIREFGWTNPILIDEDGGIIAGHGRVLAARVLGDTQVPCIVLAGLTKAQRRAYVLADNKLAMNAGWDDEMLRLELADLKADGFDLTLTGFSEEEIQVLGAETTVGLTDPDDVPDVPTAPVTVPGDVWLLGKHRIVCGSCTDAGSWSGSFPIDRTACVTSPPYGIADASIHEHLSKGDRKPPRKSLYQDREQVSEWPNLMRDWTALAVTHARVTLCNVQMLADNKVALSKWIGANADRMVDVIVWDKGHGAPQKAAGVLTNVFEFVFVMSNEQYPSRVIPLSRIQGNAPNMIRTPGARANEFASVHRAVFPVAFVTEILNMVPLATHVYEPFSGSGTTIIACEQTGRVCHAIELSPAYVDVAVKRWQAFTGKPATLEGDGRTFDSIALSRA